MSESAHVPDPTPASPLRVPAALVDLDKELSAYDDAWSECSTESERLALLNTRLRGFIERQFVGTRKALLAHEETHTLLKSLIGKVDALAGRIDAGDVRHDSLAADVAGIRRELTELVSVLKNTAGRQIEIDKLAKDGLALAGDAMDVASESQERLSHLDDDVTDLTSAVISMDAEVRPRLESVDDLAGITAETHALAEQAATTAVEAFDQAHKTKGEVRLMMAWRVVIATFSLGSVVVAYAFLRVLFHVLFGH